MSYHCEKHKIGGTGQDLCPLCKAETSQENTLAEDIVETVNLLTAIRGKALFESDDTDSTAGSDSSSGSDFSGGDGGEFNGGGASGEF